MHTLSFQTKFTFGDHVGFDSQSQHCCGSGKIFAITLDAKGTVDYMIDLRDEADLQPGVLENEIALLHSDEAELPAMHILTLHTKVTFGDRVRFNSPARHCSGHGTVVAITMDVYGLVQYIIASTTRRELQAGILADEIALDE